jgi:hypothetical protein
MQHPTSWSWREAIKRKRRVAGGRHNLGLIEDGVNNSGSLLRRIFHIFVPQISFVRKYYSDDLLNSRSERLRVAMVFSVLHYVIVFELIKLKLGFDATRS